MAFNECGKSNLCSKSLAGRQQLQSHDIDAGLSLLIDQLLSHIPDTAPSIGTAKLLRQLQQCTCRPNGYTLMQVGISSGPHKYAGILGLCWVSFFVIYGLSVCKDDDKNLSRKCGTGRQSDKEAGCQTEEGRVANVTEEGRVKKEGRVGSCLPQMLDG
eukprot:1156647-Pelagomonas_calceolata.AAC.4